MATVTNLKARTVCTGGAVYLSWTLPDVPVTELRIVASKYNPIFDLTDDDIRVVYTGPAISEFEDTGLEASTYYYYSVLCDPVATEQIPEECQATGLSIEYFDFRKWLESKTPETFLELDEMSVAEGGGGGALGRLYTVIACWANLMRGTTKAKLTLNEVDKAPFGSLRAKILSLGLEPDGYSYDYSVPRRIFRSLNKVSKHVGQCAGLVYATRMLTKWDAICFEYGYGDENGCQNRSGSLRTWDGVGEAESDSVSVGPAGEATVTRTTFTVAAASWDVGQWTNGTLTTSIGDVACVQENTTTVLTLRVPSDIATLVNAVVAGDNFITSSAQLVLNQIYQITSVDGNTYEYFRVIQTFTDTPDVYVITTGYNSYLQNAYAAGARITSIYTPRSQLVEYAYIDVGEASIYANRSAHGAYVENELVGKHLFINGAKHLIESNTDYTIIAPTMGGMYSDSHIRIADDFTAGGLPITTYRVSSGNRSRLFDPAFFRAGSRGTQSDTSSYLWGGKKTQLTGVFGSGDVGVVIQSNVLFRSMSRGSIVAGSGGMSVRLSLFDSLLAPGSVVGYMFNPNLNQHRLFEIVANTSNTITLSSSVEDIFDPSQRYGIFRPRDGRAYERLVKRLQEDFCHDDVNVHVTFR